MITKDLGAVSAYAYAVEKGYTGTEAEFAELMASYATVAQQAGESAQTASEKAQQASASATSASQSASSASASAQTAQTAQQTATAKASEAQQSAQTATTKAQEASQSASESSQSASTAVQAKTDAETAKQASETAQASAESARDDAETARDEAQQYAESIDPQKLIGAYPTDTATGSIASFTDGADNIPMKSVKVRIEPVQDLHGYDHPWPAGGGKNLLYVSTGRTYTENGVTWTLNQNGSVTVSGTATEASTFHYVQQEVGGAFNGDYYFQCFPTISNDIFQGGVRVGGTWFSVYASAKTALTGISGKIQQMWFQVRAGQTLNTTLYPMIYKASETVTEWSPYSNICPISGWTGADVVRTGKNLFNLGEFATLYPENCSYSNDTLTVNTIRDLYSAGVPCYFPKGTVVNCAITEGTAKNVRIRFVFASGEINERINSQFPYILLKDVVAIRFNWTTTGTFSVSNFQAEFGSTATDYSPYTGDTYPITFPAEAGTVYGGTLDVTNGTLTVDRAFIASYNGETLPSEWISDRDKYVAGTTPTTGAQVVYKLATPITYTLTPTEIKSLLGDNNIWADTGNTEVTYRADTTKYIDKKIAEVINALS